ncbi:MAG: LPS-assembly protein LptD [Candidatus Pelagibacter sp.]
MKNKILLLIFATFILFVNLTLAEEINLESNEIDILNKGELIKATGNVKAIVDSGLIISGDVAEYDKKKSILSITGNVSVDDKEKNIFFETDQVIYNKDKETIFTKGKTKSKIENNYEIIGGDLFHDRLRMIFSSKQNTIIKDNLGNIFETEEFKFELNEKIINTKILLLNDEFGNRYNFSNAIINLNKNEVLAKDVNVDFKNSLFGNKNNEPRLKGNAVVSNKDETNIYKAVFTTCKKIKGKNCPSWSISAEEVKHDRKKKIIKYKNAWLKIFDKPILYFPSFFHPDPSVERQSGFLSPILLNSSYSGQSIQLPYYKVLSESRDLTISPRVFLNDSFLLQTEYRQANKSSDAIIDVSFNREDEKSRSHIFANLTGFKSKNSYEINLQKVYSDKYLKLHEIESSLLNDETTLNSFLKLQNNSENYYLDASIEVFEDLSKNNNDRFEYIYPNYNFSKNIKNFNSYNGRLNFSSSGFQKNYDTNVYEGRVINDLQYSSNSFIRNGFLNRFDFLIKNVNTNSENSTNYSDQVENKLLSTIMFESRFPLFKNNNNINKNLTPIISAKYSPTETRNLKDLDRRIDYSNVFSLNRLGESDTLEGGESLTFGIEYSEKSTLNEELISIGLASIVRNSKNEDLPIKSTLGQKSSDLFGEISFNPTKNLNFEYDFSIDNNLDRANYNLLKAGLTINNFITTFEFLEEDNFIGNKSYITNQTKYNIDNNNSISFSGTKNLDKGISEYYNLIYEYENDCLSAAVEYNKTFYSDGDLKPQNNIFFMIKILPFADLSGPTTSFN